MQIGASLISQMDMKGREVQKPLFGKWREQGMTTIPQPDPNGLFMPDGLSATWLMMIDPETNGGRRYLLH